MRLFFTLAVFASVLLYAAGLEAPFYLDDSNVLEIARSGSWGVRPLGYASFWVTDQLAGMGAAVFPWVYTFYHRFPNVLIHAFAATMLFCLALELTGRWPTAAVAGTLFLVHPIQTQAITYISQRFESMAALFVLLAAVSYVRFRKTHLFRWLAAALGGAVAAGLTKETAVVLPLWLLFIEWVFFDRRALQRRAVYLAPFLVLVSIPAWTALNSAGPTLTSIPWGRYLLSQGPVLAKYLQLTIWPRNLFLFYDVPLVEAISGLVILQWLVVIGLIGLGLYMLRRNPPIGFGILSFFILLLPVTVLPLPDLIFEHRVYPGLAGLALAVAAAVTSLRAERRRYAFVAVGLIAALLSVRTVRRNAEWKDHIAFLEANRDRFPEDPGLLTRLGSYYLTRGEVNKALQVTEEARRHEDRFNSYYRKKSQVLIAINLSSLYAAKSNREAAKREALRAVEMEPGNSFALGTLGGVELALGEYAEAHQTFQKLTALQPAEPGGWEGLRAALAGLKDIDGAQKAQNRLNEENEKTSQKFVLPVIPSKFKGYIIFATTGCLLAAIILSFRTIWISVRRLLPRRPEPN